MTQNSNGHKWRKYAILLGVPLFILVWVWLAGAIFMAGNGLNAKEATPLTLYQYWYYYGDIVIISCMDSPGRPLAPCLFCSGQHSFISYQSKKASLAMPGG